MGAEAVISSKDRASELLARRSWGGPLRRGLTCTSTALYADWGTPEQRLLSTTTPPRAREHLGLSTSGSMGPEGARRRSASSSAPGTVAAVGALADIEQIVAGSAGTNVVPNRRAPAPLRDAGSSCLFFGRACVTPRDMRSLQSQEA